MEKFYLGFLVIIFRVNVGFMFLVLCCFIYYLFAFCYCWFISSQHIMCLLICQWRIHLIVTLSWVRNSWWLSWISTSSQPHIWLFNIWLYWSSHRPIIVNMSEQQHIFFPKLDNIKDCGSHKFVIFNHRRKKLVWLLGFCFWSIITYLLSKLYIFIIRMYLAIFIVSPDLKLWVWAMSRLLISIVLFFLLNEWNYFTLKEIKPFFLILTKLQIIKCLNGEVHVNE